MQGSHVGSTFFSMARLKRPVLGCVLYHTARLRRWSGIEQRVTAYIGCRCALVVVRRLALEAGRNEIPIHQVLGIVKTALVGGEQKVFSLVFHRHRVGRGTERTVGMHIVVERLEVVTDVHRIAEGARQRRLWSYHRVAWAGRQIAVALCTSFPSLPQYRFHPVPGFCSLSFSRDSRHTGARRSSLL